MNAITMLDIKKKYGDFNLCIDRLEIKQGYITGFIGENGSGKSTTMKIILDAILEDSGTVEVLGRKKGDNFHLIKSQIGFVGENSGYPNTASPDEVKKAISPFYENWDENLYQKYITRFNIPIKSKMKDLSTGQRKIFSIVMALSYHPKLLLLDEPTSGLDPVVRNDVLDILRNIMLDEEATIFYSTHITSDLEKTSDYIVYLHNGRIKLDCERDSLSDNYCIIKGACSLLNDNIKSHFEKIHYNSTSFRALCSNSTSRSIINNLLGEQIVIERASLEDIMIYAAKEDFHE